MTLQDYLTATQRLLQNPAASTLLYATADLTSYINSARSQLAGETECIRGYGSLALAYNTRSYAFSSISTGVTGASNIFTSRGVTIGVANGQVWLRPRSFPYFQTYYINNPVPQLGRPTVYSQFGQGETGSLYFDPVPDAAYTAGIDCICVPDALVATTDVEAAVPYPYTDAVPFYAAYLAFLSAQRPGDAARMWDEYQKYASRGRQISNGPVVPSQFPQSRNPVRANQLGLQQGGGNA